MQTRLFYTSILVFSKSFNTFGWLFILLYVIIPTVCKIWEVMDQNLNNNYNLVVPNIRDIQEQENIVKQSHNWKFTVTQDDVTVDGDRGKNNVFMSPNTAL